MVTKMICASCRRYLLGHQEKTLPSVIPKVMLNWFLPKSQKTGNVLVHVPRILTLASQWRELSMSLAPPPPLPPPPPRIQKVVLIVNHHPRPGLPERWVDGHRKQLVQTSVRPLAGAEVLTGDAYPARPGRGCPPLSSAGCCTAWCSLGTSTQHV